MSDMLDHKMEMWRQTNNELRALYQDELTFGDWRYVWDRFARFTPHGTYSFSPRVAARWYAGDLENV